MNKNTFAAQMTANFIASEIRKSGVDVACRMQQLNKTFAAREDFALADLTELLNPDWKPDQAEDQPEAEQAAAA